MTSDTGGYWNAAASSAYNAEITKHIYRAFDSDPTTTGWGTDDTSTEPWLCFYPDTTQDLYITGFVFIGFKILTTYRGPSSIKLKGSRNNNASTSNLTQFFSASSGLPNTSSEYYNTVPWNTNYCSVFLYMNIVSTIVGISDFFVYTS
jgi:hypothetical protein